MPHNLARRSTASSAVLLSLLLAGIARAQSTTWTLSPAPQVALGVASSAGGVEFTAVIGATVLPDGNIVVADRGDFALRLFGRDGSLRKTFGRRGKGPGELTFPQWMFRCGKDIMIFDVDGAAVSVFDVGGEFVRRFRFNSSVSPQGIYRSVCNRNGEFVHYGWETGKGAKSAVFRPQVPLWTSHADSAAGRLIAQIAGSERFKNSPLPLGRETSFAMTSDRLYVGDGDAYQIRVFALDGKVLPTIIKAARPSPVQPGDVADAMERDILYMGETSRPYYKKLYADVPLPKTMPAYRTLLVDTDENLWVQDHTRVRESNVNWTVFDKRGKQVTTVTMPYWLEVYEIGGDYVLGRYVNPDDSVPEVRLYKLAKR